MSTKREIKTTEIEEKPGVISSMRVTFRTVRRLGVFMVVFACGFSSATLLLNRIDFMTFPAILVSSAAALIAGIGTVKAWQTKKEDATEQ